MFVVSLTLKVDDDDTWFVNKLLIGVVGEASIVAIIGKVKVFIVVVMIMIVLADEVVMVVVVEVVVVVVVVVVDVVVDVVVVVEVVVGQGGSIVAEHLNKINV